MWGFRGNGVGVVRAFGASGRMVGVIGNRKSSTEQLGSSTGQRVVRPPSPHPSGAVPPAIPAEFVPRHVALVMDGNGRWAQERGLPRTAGHERGEAVLMDTVEGCIEMGVKWLSAYAFSTENWKRSPDEVRFLMGFNRDVIRRRRDEMHEMGCGCAGRGGDRACGAA